MRPADSPLLCWIILLIGIVAAAVSFVFIRESGEPPVMLAAWRVLIAATLLFPAYWRARSRHGDLGFGQVMMRSLLPGALLSAHFITWTIGARLSLGANATIIVNLVPLAMPPLLWLMFGERLNKREWLATALAVSGLGLLAIQSLRLSAEQAIGDAICLLSMVLFALYLMMAKRHRQLPNLWLYIVPVYAVSGLLSLLLAPLFGPVAPVLDARNLLMIFLLAAVSTVIGHSALNFAMQTMRGQTVAIMTLAQFIVAGLFAYSLYSEVPGLLFYPASILMTLGMLMVVINQYRDP